MDNDGSSITRMTRGRERERRRPRGRIKGGRILSTSFAFRDHC